MTLRRETAQLQAADLATTARPGSPLAPHDDQCEMGLAYGPWTDCGCLDRSNADCNHDWMHFGHPRLDEWRECFTCGVQEDL